MFIQEKFPYVFIALVGIFTWSLNNIIENTKQSPIIEYSIRSQGDSNYMLCLINLSSSDRLSNLGFKVCTNKKSKVDNFKNPSIEAVAPAFINNSNIAESKISGQCFEFKIDDFQPDNEFRINYSSLNNTGGFVRLVDSGDQAVRIMESNWLSFSVKYQMVLNLIIIGVSLILIILYIYYLKNKASQL